MEPYLIDSVEDDADIAHIINATLTKQGYEVKTFPDGESFLDDFGEKKPNMVLLDMMLPGVQGKDILKEIRKDHVNDDIQVIIISAKTMIMDKVDGLDLGADDYIEKPFDLMELMSRVNAHARRNKAVEAIAIGSLTLDLENRILKKKGNLIDLTPSEYKVAELLFKEEGKTVTREQLASVRSFAATLLGESNVDPAGEEILFVPLALPVAQQDQGVRHALSLPCGHRCFAAQKRIAPRVLEGRSIVLAAKTAYEASTSSSSSEALPSSVFSASASSDTRI